VIKPTVILKKGQGFLNFPSFIQPDLERAIYIFLNLFVFYRLGGYLLLERNPIHEFLLFRFSVPLLPFCELELGYMLLLLVLLLALEWGWLLRATRDERGLPHITRCPMFYAVALVRVFFMLFVTLPQG
jgi:hypothetical protein